ncbi:MAG: putative toxin-antitoxin system toxin component, PIN family [Acidobacteria bacterium]|nr:putative toxin-antitoxin system toxin component, PIN family [Acidobacteriota bacterium]
MNIEPPRVVFDCNIFVQMFLNPNGSAGACKELAEKGKVILFVSQAILAEVADVLIRPRFKKLFPALTIERIEAFIEEIAAISVPITNVPEEFRYERDPEDEPYINLAIVTGANYVVSLDKDLLDLMKASNEAGREFQRRYPMLKVLTPATLLAELRRR